MTFTVVGTPGDRRMTLFTAACRSRGLTEPDLIPWPDVLRGRDLAVAPGTLLRIDSPGEDPKADTLLRGPGDPARVGGGATWHANFTAALRRIEMAARRADARLLGDPGEIAVMFDKRRCHARLQAANVPVPPALPPAPLYTPLSGPSSVPPSALSSVGGYAQLRAQMARAGWGRVFVKPAHGSSASGVVALHAGAGRVRAVTSAVPGEQGWRNSLRVRVYGTEREVAALIDALAPDGLHVERWLPKAALGGRVLDLRVVVVAGTPTHAVVRTSPHPMTNLHLGGARSDLNAVWERLGEPGRRRALEICAQAAACFPRSLAVGVDLLIGTDWRRLAVAEVNAFGDLLPGLTGLPGSGAEGLDTYAAQIQAALSRKLDEYCPV